jgi:ABC-type amino acid transport substrate-binding protein
VGYDIDLVQALARSLDVRVELITAPGVILDTLVAHQQVDIALGGIVDGPRRSPRIRTSQGYQAVHLALVVRDHMVRTVESPTDEELGTPLRIALTTNRPLPTDLQHTISSLLGRNGVPRPVTFTPIGHRDRFLEPEIDTSYDALLSTAEAGASFAVLHPSMTMTPVFGKQLPTSLVIVTGMDPALSDYIDDWIGAQQQQDLFIKLFRHWVMVDQ